MRVSSDSLGMEFVCIPRPLERSEGLTTAHSFIVLCTALPFGKKEKFHGFGAGSGREPTVFGLNQRELVMVL